MTKRIPFALAAVLLASCASPSVTPVAAPVASVPDNSAALSSITADDLLRHIKVLSSDAFEGRSPGTLGEEKTVAYLIEQLKAHLAVGTQKLIFVPSKYQMDQSEPIAREILPLLSAT